MPASSAPPQSAGPASSIHQSFKYTQGIQIQHRVDRAHGSIRFLTETRQQAAPPHSETGASHARQIGIHSATRVPQQVPRFLNSAVRPHSSPHPPLAAPGSPPARLACQRPPQQSTAPDKTPPSSHPSRASKNPSAPVARSVEATSTALGATHTPTATPHDAPAVAPQKSAPVPSPASRQPPAAPQSKAAL